MKHLTATLGAALILLLSSSSWATDTPKQSCAEKKAAAQAAKTSLLSEGFASLKLTPEQQIQLRAAQAELRSKLGGILSKDQLAQLNASCQSKKQ
jgi:hypothetical protein